MNTKFIFTTGGVLSGLGKGVTSASIGNLLKSQGFKVFVLKLDPYLNTDPGAMSPIEHGEVFITNDGWRCDLDLGHYERFIDVNLTKNSNFSSGRIYKQIHLKEKNNYYKGRTIQVVPHVVDEIIEIILNTAKKEKPDFMLIEIGGTVGDIESSPHIYAMSKFALQYPKNVFFNHIAFVPYLSASKEYKSKPSQVSISTLRSFGINPNLLLLRSQGKVDKSIIDKVAAASFLPSKNVISVYDKANIYEIPIFLFEQKLLQIIYEHFNIEKPIDKTKLNDWIDFVNKYNETKKNKANLLLIGENVVLEDAYLSLISSLKISATRLSCDLKLNFVRPKDINLDKLTNELNKNTYDGIIMLSGALGDDELLLKINILKTIKNYSIPTLALGDSFKAMLFAENDSKIDLNEQNKFILTNSKYKAGSLKLLVKKDSLLFKIYNNEKLEERFYDNYDINEKYLDLLNNPNFIVSGYEKDSLYPVAFENKNHQFYLGLKYLPQYSTRVLKSNKLFDFYIKVAMKNK